MNVALSVLGTDSTARDPDRVAAGRRAAALAAHDIHADRTAADRHFIADGISLGTESTDQELRGGCPAESDFAALRVPGAVFGDVAAVGAPGYGAAVDEQLVGRGATAVGVAGIDVLAHLAAVHLDLVAGGKTTQGIPAGQVFFDRAAAHGERVAVRVRTAALACDKRAHGAARAGELDMVVRGIAVPGLGIAAVGFLSQSQITAGDGQRIALGIAFMAETGADEPVGVIAIDAATADGEVVARAVAFLGIAGDDFAGATVDVAVADLDRIGGGVACIGIAAIDTSAAPGAADKSILDNYFVAGYLALVRKTAVDVLGVGTTAPHEHCVAHRIAFAVHITAVVVLAVQTGGIVVDDDVAPAAGILSGCAVHSPCVHLTFRISGPSQFAAAIGQDDGRCRQDRPQHQTGHHIIPAAFSQDQTVAAQQHAQRPLGLFHVSSFLSRPRCSLWTLFIVGNEFHFCLQKMEQFCQPRHS